MASKAIKFSISKDEQGRTVRTHKATGLKVVTTKTDRGTEFVFYAPVKEAREVLGYWGEAHTLQEMRWMAEGRVAELLVNIEIAHEEALTEDADRALDAAEADSKLVDTLIERGFVSDRSNGYVHAKAGIEIVQVDGEFEVRFDEAPAATITFDTFFEAADEALEHAHSHELSLAVDTDPEIAAEVAEANGLDSEDAETLVAEATAKPEPELPPLKTIDARPAVTECLTLRVRFRDDFSEELRGMVFEVDTLSRRAAEGGYRFVGIRVKLNGRWRYRLAKLDDLRTVDGRRVAADPTLD